MITLVVYAILGLLVGIPPSFYGAGISELFSGLLYVEQDRVKHLEIGAFQAPIIALFISGAIIELCIFGAFNSGFLQLDVGGLVLAVGGLIIGGGTIGFLVTFIFARVLFVEHRPW